jgi:hypothetical protein
MLQDRQDQDDRAAAHRASARALRRIARTIRFDLCHRKQLCALADGFDRLAQRIEATGIKDAAD